MSDGNENRQTLVDQLRAVVRALEHRRELALQDPPRYPGRKECRSEEGLLTDIGALLVAEPPTIERDVAVLAEVDTEVTDFAARELGRSRAPHVIVVVPEQWDAICRDRFVFGSVAAVAFERYGSVRITTAGYVFEREQAPDAEELKRLSARLDEEAAWAFEIRKALAQLRPLCREGNHDFDDLRRPSRSAIRRR